MTPRLGGEPRGATDCRGLRAGLRRPCEAARDRWQAWGRRAADGTLRKAREAGREFVRVALCGALRLGMPAPPPHPRGRSADCVPRTTVRAWARGTVSDRAGQRQAVRESALDPTRFQPRDGGRTKRLATGRYGACEPDNRQPAYYMFHN